MGMYALAFNEALKVSQGLEKEREGEVVGKNGVAMHVGVNRERGVGGVVVREGPNEGVADEDMGLGVMGEEEEGGIQEA